MNAQFVHAGPIGTADFGDLQRFSNCCNGWSNQSPLYFHCLGPIHGLMKPTKTLKVERDAVLALRAFLAGLPRTHIDFIKPVGEVEAVDIRAEFRLDRKPSVYSAR